MFLQDLDISCRTGRFQWIALYLEQGNTFVVQTDDGRIMMHLPFFHPSMNSIGTGKKTHNG